MIYLLLYFNPHLHLQNHSLVINLFENRFIEQKGVYLLSFTLFLLSFPFICFVF